jgi:hypothetical protein
VTPAAREPSEDLIQGRRELDDVPGYRRVTDLSWRTAECMWKLHFTLAVPLPPEAVVDHTVPEMTAWVALIAPEYPHGRIEIYPAALGGITETYPHQKPNLPPLDGRSWRRGDICVTTPFAILQREGYDTEPRAPALRLAWHVARTRAWVEAARRGTLLGAGEPYELPVYAIPESSPRMVFESRAADLTSWQTAAEGFGIATIVTPSLNSRLRVLARFAGSDRSNQRHGLNLPEPRWGTALRGPSAVKQEETAIWVRLPRAPVLPPWRAPATWGELVACLGAEEVDIMHALERTAWALRDGKAHLLLLGAPLPARVGEPTATIHWLAVQLPALSHAEKTRKGHRPGERGYWLRDRAEVFRAGRPLTWVQSENWSPDEIATRGRAALGLRQSRVVIIGVGALGSALADLLVREGVTHITLMDNDDFGAGNLVRHALTISDIGEPKARALADRLNSANPHAMVQAVNAGFPGGAQGEAALQSADIVVDCTGNDALIDQLGAFEWGSPKLFVSCAVGLFAKRLFVFTTRGVRFAQAEFAAQINPWLRGERDEFSGAELPWEGTGCWHPVFPARASDFALFGAAVLRRLEAVAGQSEDTAVLHVLERFAGEDGILGLRLAEALPGRRCA